MSEAMQTAVITLIGAITTCVIALAALLRSQASAREVHQVCKRQNGLLNDLLAEARLEGYRQGLLEGAWKAKAPPTMIAPPPATSPADDAGGKR